MAKIPSKVESHIKEALKRYKPDVEKAQARDNGDADMSTLVKDILADLFGNDKYSDVTAEYHEQRMALSLNCVGAVVQNETVRAPDCRVASCVRPETGVLKTYGRPPARKPATSELLLNGDVAFLATVAGARRVA